MRLIALPLVIALSFVSVTAQAADLGGFWERSSGTSRIRFEPCARDGSGTLCGTIAWIKPGVKSKAHVGQAVLLKLVKTGDVLWTGEAFNPEDGRTYRGSVTLDGRTVVTKGCILGGMVCKTETWTRVN